MTVRWDVRRSNAAVVVSCETEGGCHKMEILCNRDAAFVLKDRLGRALSLGEARSSEHVAFLHGFCAALYEMIRLTSRADLVREAMQAHGVSIEKLRSVDAVPYQLAALEAGLK